MHRLLERQLVRVFGSLDAVPSELNPFLELVEQAYLDADQERRLSEHSMDLASQELMERNKELLEQVERLERTQEELARQQDDFRRIVETASEGIWILDDKDRVQFVNQAMSDLLGLEAGDIIGHKPMDFMDPGLQAEFGKRLQERRAGKMGRFEHPFHRADGSELWLHVSSTPIVNGDEYLGVLGMFTDITARRQAEQGLMAAYERLQSVDEARSRFINNAAHELGTPITPLKIQIQVLRKVLEKRPDERIGHSLDIFDRNVDRLIELVSDLVDSARLQAGKMDLVATHEDLARLVQDSAGTMRPFAEARGITLEVEGAPTLMVRCDPKRIAQVLDNLLSNGIKFNHDGGGIRIRAYPDGGNAVVQVMDDGIGIERDKMGDLFRPFRQVHDTMDVTDAGTGLGLYLCKGIIEESGGRIWAESRGSGKGSVFSFSLPLALRDV